MTSADRAALVRELESQGLFVAAAELRAQDELTQLPAELGRAARDAEERGDWRRWYSLLEAGAPSVEALD